MNILFKTRCTKGHLVVYDNKVAIELSMLGTHNVNSLPYSQITGVEIKTTMATIPFFSKGRATVQIYAKGNQKLEASLVELNDAKKVQALIEERLQ